MSLLKIAIHGKKNSGKDTLAKIIKSSALTYNIPVYASLSFADKIKKITIELFPFIPYEWISGDSELRENIVPELNKSVRDILKDIGKFGRNYNSKIWIDHTLNSVKFIEDKNTFNNSILIIKDLRMLDEFQVLKENNFTLIRLIRPNQKQDNHSTETDLDCIPDSEFDYVILNDKSIEELKDKTNEMVKDLLKRRNV